MTVRRMIIKSVIAAVLLLEVLGQRTTREVGRPEAEVLEQPREAFTEWGYGDCAADELGVVMGQSLTCLHTDDPVLTDVRTWVGLAGLLDVVPEDSPAFHCGWMGDRRCG